MSQNANTASLAFSETYRTANITLLELTEDLLKELESEGRFVIKGSETEEAVLCTSKASFVVREAPSSNNMLLLETNPLKSGVGTGIVVKTLQAHYQLNRTTVNMELLKSLLRARPLGLTSEEGDEPGMDVDGIKAPLYTMDDLEKKIQCSLEELRTALKSIGAFEHLGHIRVLTLEAEYAIARHVALTINAQGMDLNAIAKKELLAKSKSSRFSNDLIAFVVGEYLEAPSLTPESDDTRYSFNIHRYNALAARTILSNRPQWSLDAFVEAWQALLPDNFITDQSSLDGIAYTEEHGKETRLCYLLATGMSHNPKTRLAELFKAKSKWTFAQIKPYLQDLVTPDMNEEQLLVAFTRSSNGPNGTKLYSSR